MGLCANLLASDIINYEFTMICRAVNGFICAIEQAFVKLISNVTPKVTGCRQAAPDGVWVPGGGIVPAIANRYTVRSQIENGEIDDLVTYAFAVTRVTPKVLRLGMKMSSYSNQIFSASNMNLRNTPCKLQLNSSARQPNGNMHLF